MASYVATIIVIPRLDRGIQRRKTGFRIKCGMTAYYFVMLNLIQHLFRFRNKFGMTQ